MKIKEYTKKHLRESGYRWKIKFTLFPKRIDEDTLVWLQFIAIFQRYKGFGRWQDCYGGKDNKVLCYRLNDEGTGPKKFTFKDFLIYRFGILDII